MGSVLAGHLPRIRESEPHRSSILTSAGRREAALACCQRQSRKFAEMFKTDAPARNPYLAAFDRRPMVAALATDFVWAFDAVASLIRDMRQHAVGLSEIHACEGASWQSGSVRNRLSQTRSTSACCRDQYVPPFQVFRPWRPM